MTFRIPVSENSGLIASVVTEDAQKWSARPSNISLSGLLLPFGHNEDPVLRVGQAVRLELKLNEITVPLQGHVKRKIDRAYGIHFVETSSAPGIHAPTELQEIVNQVEKSWKRQKKSST